MASKRYNARILVGDNNSHQADLMFDLAIIQAGSGTMREDILGGEAHSSLKTMEVDMSKVEKLNIILECGVIAIMRTKSSDQLIAAADAIKAGGVSVIEVTMTTPGALTIIAEARRRYGPEMLFGAGTVLDAETARSAILAGADFVVAPTFNLDMVEPATATAYLLFRGATASGLLIAWQAGADTQAVSGFGWRA
jgi:hypothetical protein